MILFIHIAAATSSLALAAYALFKPSHRLLNIVYGLAIATIASGTILIVMLPAKMTQTCQTGLTYLALMIVAILVARHRLAAIEAK